MEVEQQVLEQLRAYTKHRHVKIVNSGNAAIFAALYIAKQVNAKPFVLIPDQGGWISYKTYPKIFNFEIKEIKTKQGIIDLQHLQEEAETGAALLLPSFAGYAAEHHLFQIAKVCKDSKCLLVEDATGAIGDEKLCNGEFSDIIIGSFGKSKVVDYGFGGFLSTKYSDYFEKAKVVFSFMDADLDYGKLLKKLQGAPVRLQFLLNKAEEIKKDLQGFAVLHQDKRGLNVIVKYKNEEEKQRIIAYCREREYEYLECPKYIRVMEQAISIEVKRL